MDEYQKYPRLLSIQEAAEIVAKKMRELVIIPALKTVQDITIADDDLQPGRPRVTVHQVKDTNKCFFVVVDYDGSIANSYIYKLQDGRYVEFSFNYIHLQFMMDETARYITTRVVVPTSTTSVHIRIHTFTNIPQGDDTHDAISTREMYDEIEGRILGCVLRYMRELGSCGDFVLW